MASVKLRIKQSVSMTLTALLLIMTVLPAQALRAAEATVVITSPTENQTITTNADNKVQVTGYVNNVYPDGLKVVAQGIETQVSYEASGSFSTWVVLADGVNVIEVLGTGPEGTESKSVTVNYQTGAPVINVTNPVGDTQTVGSVPYTISGTVYNGTIQSVTVDGRSMSVSNQTATNQWSSIISSLSLGLNKVIIVARNSSKGKTTTKELYITYDTAPNVLNLEPTNNSIVDSSNLTLKGNLVNSTRVQVSINGGVYSDISVVGQNLSHNLTLSQGNNQISIKIYNGTRVTTKTINVTYYAGTPHLYNVTPTSNAVYSSTVRLTGSILYADGLDITSNGGAPATSPISGNNFSINVPNLQEGSNTIVLTPRKGTVLGTPVSVQVQYYQAPKITLDGTLNYEAIGNVTKSVYWNDRLFTLGGSVVNTTQLKLNQDGVQTNLIPDGSGRFTTGLTLRDGINVIKLTASNNTSSITELTLNVEYRFNGQATITILQPTNANQDVHVNESKLTIEGQVSNVRYLSVQINSGVYQSVYFDGQGKFKREMTLIGGLNTINFRGENNAGISTKTVTVYFDQIPEITITAPKADAEIKTNAVVVSGTVKYCDTKGLTINDEEVGFSYSTGAFSKEITLNPEQTQIIVKAKRGDLVTTKNVAIAYKGTPEIVFFQPADKGQVYSNVLNIRGQIRGVAGSLDTTEVTVNNKTVTADVYGKFSTSTVLKLGSNTISATAKLATKKTVSKSIKVTYLDLAMTGAEVQTTVPINGTTIKLFEGNFELKVPKNAFARETTVTTEIKENDDYQKNAGDTLYVGNIYDISGQDPEKPLTLTLKYVTGIKDVQAAKIGIYKYDDDDDEWVPIGGKVDAKKGTVTAEIDKLGTYTVMAYIKTFNDIRGHWAQKDIEIMLAKGIANGRWDYRFAPDEQITRAEFVKMLVKAMGIPMYEETKASFYDVGEDDWEFAYVQAAARAGIVKGTANRSFNPNKNITRAEAATMVARAANLTTASGQSSLELLDSFKDKRQIATYAQDSIAGVVKAGLFKGMADGTFRPAARTTRAETAKMLVRLMTLEKRL